ncbi:MAG TPA: hypothetical protein VF736_22060 [Pyrinomonadaceae bacterium]
MFSRLVGRRNFSPRVWVAAAMLAVALPVAASAQTWPKILEGEELSRVVPSSFYFEGQSAPTQMRNAAAAQFGPRRFVMAALVDTSGYSSDVQAKYQGFFITDAPVFVGGARLGTGAYGFGFTNDGRLNVLDLGGRVLLTVRAPRDAGLQRPRPLMMTQARNGVRLYAGRNFVLLSSR